MRLRVFWRIGSLKGQMEHRAPIWIKGVYFQATERPINASAAAGIAALNILGVFAKV
jgi:hypothetical protein